MAGEREITARQAWPEADRGEGPSVLHVVPRLANCSGPAHIAISLAEAQARLGNNVRIICVRRTGELQVLPDVSLVGVKSFRESLRVRNYCYSSDFRRAIRDEVAAADAVHIHTIWTYPTWLTMKECVAQGVPYVVAPQGSFEPWALRRSRFAKMVYGALCERPLYRRAARFQCVTEHEVEQCRSHGIDAPTEVLPNPVNLRLSDSVEEKAGNVRKQYGCGSDELVILFLGRLFPKKGLNLLVEMLADVVDRKENVSLWIAGTDAGSGYQRRVQRAFEDAGLMDHVRFLGEISGSHKIRVLKAADLFVLPSYSEGLPVAVLEAMAAGLPTVTTPGCNLPELASKAAGWVAEPEPSTLSRVVLEALNNDAERTSRAQAAREIVARQFADDAIARDWIGIYRAMMAEARG